MLDVLLARLRQGYRTMKYPDAPPPPLPDRFRGRPIIDRAQCPAGCRACADACPTQAIRGLTFKRSDPVSVTSVSESPTPGISKKPSKDQAASVVTAPQIDLGQCLFCTECADACPHGALTHSADWRLATRRREDLIADIAASPAEVDAAASRLAAALDAKTRRLFGRSFKLRQVSAGGCNACEADVNVLGTIGWDLGRFGIQMVASPRHADGLLVTGPVPANMHLALRKTYEAIAPPRIVIAAGACAISGGLYRDLSQSSQGAAPFVPIDLHIPGCPPHPLTILDGLLRLLGRIEAAPGR